MVQSHKDTSVTEYALGGSVVSTPCMTLLKLPHGAYRYACQSEHLKPELELHVSCKPSRNTVCM